MPSRNEVPQSYDLEALGWATESFDALVAGTATPLLPQLPEDSLYAAEGGIEGVMPDSVRDARTAEDLAILYTSYAGRIVTLPELRTALRETQHRLPELAIDSGILCALNDHILTRNGMVNGRLGIGLAQSSETE